MPTPCKPAQEAPDDAFEDWVIEHGKTYAGDRAEYEKRREIWKDNLAFVHEYNLHHSTHWVRPVLLLQRVRLL